MKKIKIIYTTIPTLNMEKKKIKRIYIYIILAALFLLTEFHFTNRIS
jgi:hypothetical protein